MKEKIYINFILIFVFVACQSNNCKPVEREDQNEELFDVIRGELVHETEDTVWFEEYIKKIPKSREIFKKGKNYIYQAKYFDEFGNLLSDNNIKLIPTGKRTDFAPETQDLVIYEFMNYKSDSINLHNRQLNYEMNYWTNESNEGIIENEEEIWIHPMRTNQYKFTEVAPFPEIRLPLEIGKEWESSLNIKDGWGEWSNKTCTNIYKVIRKDSFNLNNNQILSWIVTAKSECPFGESKLEYQFNEKYGFLELKYLNYQKEILEIKMINIEKT